MQQSRYTDIQLLQRQLMLKQLQELQRQQQLPQFCDIRQQNNVNHPFSAAKKAMGDFSQVPLMNGTPIHDTSQLFTSWDQRSTSAIVHGWQNRVGSSVEQGQALHETGFLSQHLGAPGGSPVASSRSSDNHLRGISPETANLFAKSSDFQPPTMSNQFLVDQPSLSSEQVCMSGGGYMDEEGCLVQKMFEKQSGNGEQLQETLEPFNVHQRSAPLQDYNWKQNQTCWSGNLLQEPSQVVGCSQELDPLEKQILFNSDDNIWDASGRKSGGFGSLFEAADSLPSLHSGSWSALMQSAVAETSSGDTGLTEEWSGLTVQNADNSTSNQPSSVVDSGNQPSRWVDTNSQTSFSISSKAIHAFTSMSSGFPVVQVQHSPMQEIQTSKSISLAGLDHNSQQLPQLNVLSTQYNNEHPQVKINQLSISPHFNLRPAHAQEQGEKYEATCKVESGNNARWHGDNVNALQNWRMAEEGSGQLCSATANLLLKKEDPKNMYLSNSHNFEVVHHVANQTDFGQPNFSSQHDIPMLEKEDDCADRNSGQVRGTDSLLIANEAANEMCPMSNVRDKFTGHDQQYVEQLKFFGNASNIINIPKECLPYDGGNLTKSYQIPSVEDHKSKMSSPPDGAVGSSKINVTTLRSVAERDWAQATNHLIEKVDNEVDGRQTKLRSKRRIILTTQLMQQLLRAPPAWTLSVNAALTYDCLTYIVAKTALTDASALTECPNSNKISDNVEFYLKNGDGCPGKLVEDITSKMRILEDNIARLEKTSPLVSEMKLELQDLERYRVANRFAAFHVRPQQSSSGGTPLKPNPQRHVVISPIAEMPPELQCLSL